VIGRTFVNEKPGHKPGRLGCGGFNPRQSESGVKAAGSRKAGGKVMRITPAWLLRDVVHARAIKTPAVWSFTLQRALNLPKTSPVIKQFWLFFGKTNFSPLPQNQRRKTSRFFGKLPLQEIWRVRLSPPPPSPRYRIYLNNFSRLFFLFLYAAAMRFPRLRI
jgi:hypothetical protein